MRVCSSLSTGGYHLVTMIKLFITLTFFVQCYAIQPGPLVIATKGEVWPKPQLQNKTQDYFVLRPNSFSFKAPDDIGCFNLLDDALSRYWTIIDRSGSLERRGRLREVGKTKRKKFWLVAGKNFLGYLESLNITLGGKCSSDDIRPEFADDESYDLKISANEASLNATTIWGILRGLETFSQLIYLEQDSLVINATEIRDYARFSHRGLLLDTARHFLPVYSILHTLDAMAYNKLNVFHWHIVDDQSFPYKSRIFPELSERGAYHPISKIYDQSDVKKIVEYARVRGIRVIPEFDTPGHTRSWGVSHPEILTPCYTNNKTNGKLGPMDPTKQSTYDFVTKLFTEVVEDFPDSYFHVGGDEVDFECWRSNPDITAFMQQQNLTTYQQVEGYFVQKVLKILDDLKAKYLVWEEVFVDGVNVPNSTVVHVWKDLGQLTLAAVTQAGKFALYSSCWYLDYLYTGGDWQKFYDCEPLDFPGTPEEKKLVLGGEACMWAESVNEYNVMSRVWPRASAAAEKLWSDRGVNDLEDAMKRLEEHTCRMNLRGIQAEPPNGPGVCL